MKTSTAGPLGVLPGAPAAATIIVDEDVDGGPLGVLPGALAAATIVVDEDDRRRAPLRIFRSIVVCVNF
jgi:hypothetical protein